MLIQVQSIVSDANNYDDDENDEAMKIGPRIISPVKERRQKKTHLPHHHGNLENFQEKQRNLDER